MNIAVFFLQISLATQGGAQGRAFVMDFALIPAEILHNANLPFSPALPPYLTLVTSMFLHGGIGHIVGNMWFLWLFGDNIEDTMGHLGFLVFYFVTGIAAGLVHVMLMPASTTPTLGASGAVSGVLGAYLMLFPRIRIRTLMILGFFIQVIRIPAVFYLGVWFIGQAVGIFGGEASGVAFGAHVGGFVAGAILCLLFSRRRPSPPAHRYDPLRVPRW